MASLAELENRRGQILAELQQVSAQEQEVYKQQRQVNAELRAIKLQLQNPNLSAAQKDQLAQQGTELETQYNVLEVKGVRLAEQRQRLEAQLADIDQQIRTLRAQTSQPLDSAGQEAVNAQNARDESASATVPPPAPPPARVPTNADAYEVDNVDNVDNPYRDYQDTQGTPAITASPGGLPPGAPSNNDDNGSSTKPRATNTTGAGATGDDARALRSFIDQTFSGETIKAQSNALDQFASYTYNISIYIMGPEEYKRWVRTKQRKISGFQLLIKSGGAGPAGQVVRGEDIPITVDDPREAGAYRVQNLGRNEFFDLDYYIDDVRINHFMAGKGTGGAHTATDMTFRIIEPNGMTFLDNLYAATQQYVAIKGGNGRQNYAAQNYLMVIRFYGYDSTGRLVTDQKLDIETTNPDGSTTTKQATIEKFIPFQFTEVKFRVANRLVEYDCKAVCPQNNVATSAGRGQVPYNVELQSQTLKELLTGNLGFSQTGATAGTAGGTGSTAFNEPDQGRVERVQTRGGVFERRVSGGLGSTFDPFIGQGAADFASPVTAGGGGASQTQAPAKVNAAPQKNLITGLVKALNGYQEERVNNRLQQWADNYNIVIVGDALQNAKMAPPGEVNRRQVPMIKAQDPAQAKLGTKQAVANTTKTSQILSGQSIVQFIDQVVRSSSYIYNQQLKIIDSNGGEVIVNADPAKTVAWFRIGIEAVPRGDAFYDNIRNDFAYDITYQISPYAVSEVKSPWFPRSQFRGTHKRYDYWFTGKNSQVLDLVQDYNYLYYMVMTYPGSPARNNYNARELEKAFPQPNSNQTVQGVDKNTNEPQANATDYLYSPGDQAKIRLRIVGDPAWIQQGELSNGIQGSQFNYGAFLPDGTISYESQDILFEVNYNRPVDYDTSTGIQDPGTKNYNRRPESQGLSAQTGDARQSFVYQAVRCTSIFAKGRFEQELEGALRTFPNPTQQTKARQSDQNAQAQAAAKGQSSNRQAQINQPDASPGLLDLDAGVSGTVNYQPRPLSQVLDQKQAATPSTARFGRASQAGAPTSGTQTVGTPGAPGAAGPANSEPKSAEPSQTIAIDP